ncbi:30S ribosomal protein S1 [Candidatus Zinderia endosymbiont of Aphrophora alni]|uniref:30S ribosomal protein S1 n=1 Tax=Candidatus Zinderia endosymbiont of Aphrophora alni TaxID=3077951 RepID=UPI0030D38A84
MNIKYFKNASRNSVFANLLKEFFLEKNIVSKEIILVKVIDIDKNFVIVNTDLKSEGFIPISEFKNDRGKIEVIIGDLVFVVVESLENGFGDTILSREKAKRLSTWLSMEKALKTQEVIIGTIIGKVKGGLTVLSNGLRAFLPGSLVDIKPVKDISSLEGRYLEFKVIKLDRERNNVVLSRKIIIEKNINKERMKVVKTLFKNSVVEGIVKNITDYGVFIDLGGIDGLLHITDLAWRRIKHPSEILVLGQKVLVKVLKYDKNKKKVSLGMKQLEKDPWKGLSKKYPKGVKMLGKVTNITDYGVFLEIEPGIEGLVHISEMNWTNKNVIPNKFFSLGSKVNFVILNIDEIRRRISLSVKYCLPNPWEDFFINYKKGSRIIGTIKSISDFGIFVKLTNRLDGLIHFSDLSWSFKRAKKILCKFKKGNILTTILISVDIKREKLSLGLKQFFLNPFKEFIKFNKIGSRVLGVIKNFNNYFINIKLIDKNVFGVLKIVGNYKIFLKKKNIYIGKKIFTFIINFNIKSCLLILSFKKNS